MILLGLMEPDDSSVAGPQQADWNQALILSHIFDLLTHYRVVFSTWLKTQQHTVSMFCILQL